MFKKLLLVTLGLGLGFVASANELDADRFNAKNPPLATNIILRVNRSSNAQSVLKIKGAIKSKADAHKLMLSANFSPVLKSNNAHGSELDHEAGSSSWYWYSYNNYYVPYYYNVGYYYAPYYTYYTPNYYYYCYGYNYGYGYGW